MAVPVLIVAIAAALIEASQTVGFNVPLVVRLEGTEVEEGRKMLADSDVDIINASWVGASAITMREAVQREPDDRVSSQLQQALRR